MSICLEGNRVVMTETREKKEKGRGKGKESLCFTQENNTTLQQQADQ